MIIKTGLVEHFSLVWPNNKNQRKISAA